MRGKKKYIQIGQSQLLNPGNINASLITLKERTKQESEKIGIDKCAD